MIGSNPTLVRPDQKYATNHRSATGPNAGPADRSAVRPGPPRTSAERTGDTTVVVDPAALAAARRAGRPATPGVPDELWNAVEPLLPVRAAPELGGRPRADERAVYSTILFVMSTGCSWRTADRVFGVAKSTAHRRYREWASSGLWPELHQQALNTFGPLGLEEWVRRVSSAAGLGRHGVLRRRLG